MNGDITVSLRAVAGDCGGCPGVVYGMGDAIMGQAKLRLNNDETATLHIYTRQGGEWEHLQSVAFPFPRHLRGTARRGTIEQRGGAIVGLLQYPHAPDVVADIRKAFTPETAADMIPALQEIGRQMLRCDWWIECEARGVENPPLHFYSSMEVARELAPDDDNIKATEATEFARLAGVIA